MTRMRVLITLVLLVSLFSATTSAQSSSSSFMSYQNLSIGFGARALSMGGAFIALADDITAISYNPAGLAQMYRPEFSLGYNYMINRNEQPASDWNDYYSQYDYYRQGPLAWNFNTNGLDYFGGAIPFKIAGIPVVVGGAYQIKDSSVANYQSITTSERGWEASYTDENTMVQDIVGKGSMKTTTISLAVRPFRFLYLGFNLNFWKSNQRDRANFADSGHTDYLGSPYIDYTNDGYTTNDYQLSGGRSYDIGLLIKSKILSLGFVYKSKFDINYLRNYHYHNVYTEVPGDSNLSDWIIESEGILKWPYSYGGGIALRPSDTLTFSADYTFTHWSSGSLVLSDGKEYDYPTSGRTDTWQVRIGMEYLILMKKVAIPLRGGWFLDNAFWGDINGDPVRLNAFSIGTGVVLDNFVFDLAAVYRYGAYDRFPAQIITGKYERSNFRIVGSVSVRIGR